MREVRSRPPSSLNKLRVLPALSADSSVSFNEKIVRNGSKNDDHENV